MKWCKSAKDFRKSFHLMKSVMLSTYAVISLHLPYVLSEFHDGYFAAGIKFCNWHL